MHCNHKPAQTFNNGESQCTSPRPAPPLAIADSVDAQALVTDHCTRCHGSEIYTRENRRVTSLPALHTQVRMCEQNLGLTWFDNQIDAVANLLNTQFYKFDR
jgi:hypothetical protein